jgi:hypothetical protein
MNSISDLDVGMSHVLIASAHVHELLWHDHCLSCGSTDSVLRRRVETRASQPGVHFVTWTGRSLRLPLCLACGARIRNRLEAPLLVWFLALPVAVGLVAFAFGGLLPFPGVVLTGLIAVPIWLVRRWQNFWPLEFEVTDYKNHIDFEWTDYDRAAKFAALNGAEVLGP